MCKQTEVASFIGNLGNIGMSNDEKLRADEATLIELQNPFTSPKGSAILVAIISILASLSALFVPALIGSTQDCAQFVNGPMILGNYSAQSLFEINAYASGSCNKSLQAFYTWGIPFLMAIIAILTSLKLEEDSGFFIIYTFGFSLGYAIPGILQAIWEGLITGAGIIVVPIVLSYFVLKSKKLV